MKIDADAYIELNKTQKNTDFQIVFGRPFTGKLVSNGDSVFLKFGNNFFKLNIDFPLSKSLEEVIFYPTHYEDNKLYVRIIDFIGEKGQKVLDTETEVNIISKMLEEIGIRKDERNLTDMLKIFHAKLLGQDSRSLQRDQIKILYSLCSAFSIFQIGYKDDLPSSFIRVEKYKNNKFKHSDNIKLDIYYNSPLLGLINIRMDYNSTVKNLDVEFNCESAYTRDLLYENRYKIEQLLKSEGLGVKTQYTSRCIYGSMFDFIFNNSFNERI